MKSVFKLLPEQFGGEPVVVAWGPQNSVLAVAGRKRSVALFSRDGTEVSSFSLEAANVHVSSSKKPSAASVNTFLWNSQGPCSACLLELVPSAVLGLQTAPAAVCRTAHEVMGYSCQS